MNSLQGGAVPLVRAGRTVHAFDGATYALDVTWLRRVIRVEYHSPRVPRKIRARRAEAAEAATWAAVHAAAAKLKQAGGSGKQTNPVN